MSSVFLRENKSQISVIAVLFGIFILFTIGSPQTFLSYNIYYSFMSTIPFFAIMALSLTLVVISGEMDLSFPSIMGFAGWAFTVIFHRTGSVGIGLIISLIFGLGAGSMNGWLVVKLKLPSMITTIGTQFFWAGATAVVSGGLGKTLVPAKTNVIYSMLVGRLGGKVPAQMIWTVIIAFVIWLFLNRHRFGAHIYFIGDNPESARVMGINVDRVKMMVFTQMGLFAAFAGILASLEVTYYWPTLGQGYLLKTIAAVYLGGTPVDGGVGTIFGTFIGAIILGCLEAGIIAIGMTGFWTQLIYGLIVIVSIAMHSVLRKR